MIHVVKAREDYKIMREERNEKHQIHQLHAIALLKNSDENYLPFFILQIIYEL